MLAEIAIVVCCALIGSSLFKKLGAPGLLGMMVAGVVLGPSGLSLISPNVQGVLAHFKTLALIVILVRAGLGINRATLRKIGGPAIRLGSIPCLLEGFAVAGASHLLLGLGPYEAGMLGFIVAAVSPAVVVPQMLELKASGLGEQNEVPTLVLAGASLDDVFAITLFGVFAGLSGGSEAVGLSLLLAPVGVFVGGALGLGLGQALCWAFGRFPMRDGVQVITLAIVAVVFYEGAELPSVKQRLPIASLLGIMAIGFVILEKREPLARKLAAKFNEIWVLAEVLLFVYIGAEVQLSQLDGELLGVGLLVLFVGLSMRSVGVAFSLRGTALDRGERVFCVLAYLPKATVQAAMGAVPLSLALQGKLGGTSAETGQTILAIAVLSIAVTAPLGALAIRRAGPRLLRRPEAEPGAESLVG